MRVERDDEVGRLLAGELEEGLRLGRHGRGPFVVHQVDAVVVPIGAEFADRLAAHRVDPLKFFKLAAESAEIGRQQ